mmetsp:Transcript_17579/g.31728  ORF Transcript_17579/g.31728 Transcript_17579/m.31728 type:complete len:809 (+) Transcript_17579:28-2454(+)
MATGCLDNICFGAQRLPQPRFILLEGWLTTTCSRRPSRPEKLYVRLSGEALWLFAEKPPQLDTQPNTVSPLGTERRKKIANKPKRQPTPKGVILLTHVMALVGRSQDSDHIQLLLSDGAWYDMWSSWWWEFRTDPVDGIEEWTKAISKRLDLFRECRMVSVRASTRRASQKLRSVRLGKQSLIANSPSPRSGGGFRYPSVVSSNSSSTGLRRAFINDNSYSILNAMEHWLLMLPCAPHGFFSARVSGQIAPYQGARNVRSDLADPEKFEARTALDLQELEGMQWTKQAVSFLERQGKVPENLALDFCFTLRQGVPDGLKHLLWSLAVGVFKQLKDAEESYSRALSLAFGDIVPHTFKGAVPTFNGDEVQSRPVEEVAPLSQILTEDGVEALSRLLWCARLLHAKLDFCPILPNLLAMLLLFFTEAEAGVIISKILVKAEQTTTEDFPSLATSIIFQEKQVKLVHREAAHVEGAALAVKHLDTLEIFDAVVRWLLFDGFAQVLPFRALCRVYGCLIAEGTEILVRFCLSILQIGASRIQASSTEQGVKDSLIQCFAKLDTDHVGLEELVKAAFAVRLRRSLKLVSSYQTSATSMGIARSTVSRGRLLCRPRLHEPRGLPPEEVWEAIWGWVPEIYRVLDPRLTYSTASDGRSLRTLMQKCKQNELAPMIFFAYTLDGALLGGFSPVMWRKTDGYLDLTGRLGVEESFVFRRTSPSDDTDVFLWSGRNTLLFQASEVEGLLFGGDGASIYVDKDMKWACTTESTSFLADLSLVDEEGPAPEQPCPPLIKGEQGSKFVDFELLHLEVFALR